MTRGEEIIDAVRSALERLQALTFGAYARADIANVVDPLNHELQSGIEQLNPFHTSGNSNRDRYFPSRA